MDDSDVEQRNRKMVGRSRPAPAALRYAFKAALTIVPIWVVFQLGYWLVFGIINEGPFPRIMLVAGYVAIASWSAAIAIRWGYSLMCKRQAMQDAAKDSANAK